MNVLVIDIGGTHVKVLATGQKNRTRISFRSNITSVFYVWTAVKETKGKSLEKM